MANKKISALTELAATPASGDMVPVVDVSDSTGAATGTTKKVSVDNLISNIAVADMAGSAVVTESEGISGNDNDTTLPTSAAVKDYVDTQILTEDTLAELNDTEVTTPASANLLLYDGTDSWDNKALGGDATIDNAGALTLANTAVVAGSYTASDITVDSKGRITAAANGSTAGEANQNAWSTITVPAGTTSQAADTATDTLAFTAAGGMTITGGADDTIEFSSADTNTNQLTTFDIGVDTNTNATTIAHGETLTLAGGANVATETTADGTVTITATDTDTTYTAGTGLALSGTTFSSDINGLTDITGTGDTSGWSAGDHIAVADASDSNNSKRIKLPAEIGVACSDEATAITTTGDKATLMVPRGMRITEVKANVTVAETTNSVVVNVKYHATTPGSAATIFSDSNGCTIATSAYKNNRVTFDDGAGGSQAYYDVAEDGFIVVSVEATAPTDAKGLKVWLLGYWS